MKRVLSAVALYVTSLPAFAAAQEAAADTAPAIEPLGTGYLLFLAAVFAAIVVAFWKYCVGAGKSEDKPESK